MPYVALGVRCGTTLDVTEWTRLTVQTALLMCVCATDRARRVRYPADRESAGSRTLMVDRLAKLGVDQMIVSTRRKIAERDRCILVPSNKVGLVC